MSRPTNSELEILRILWKLGPSTVRRVNEEMNRKKEVGYTTTLKFMQIMYEKGYLSRTRDGRTHIYEAALSEKDSRQQLLDRLLDTAFQGSALKLVMQALGSRKSSPEELDEIRRFLDQLDEDQPS